MAETSASKLSKRIHTDGSTHYKGATAPANVLKVICGMILHQAL
jgi:hypothetical protein